MSGPTEGMRQSSIWRQTFAAVAASSILASTGILWSNVYALFIEDLQYYRPMSYLLCIGFICGPLLALMIVDRLGRRRTLLLAIIPLVLSFVLIKSAAFISSLIYPAPFLIGSVIGVASMVTPMYVGEIADRRFRGSLCVMMSVMIGFGRLLSNVTQMWEPPVGSVALAILGIVFPILSATALLWCPESPYYFAMRKLPNEVHKSVTWLRGTPEVVEEVRQIQDSTALNQSKPKNFFNLFRVLGIRKALRAIIGLFLCKQLSGCATTMIQWNLIMNNDYYRECHRTVYTITIVFSIITSISVIAVVDKLGRKPLLLASVAFSTMISLIAVLHHMLVVNKIDVGAMWLFPIIIQVGYSTGFSIGLGTLPFVIAGEIFSSEVKTLALGITFFLNSIAQLVVYVASSYMQYYIEYVAIVFPVVIPIVSGVFIYFAVPETKERSLNEIAFHGHFNRQI